MHRDTNARECDIALSHPSTAFGLSLKSLSNVTLNSSLSLLIPSLSPCLLLSSSPLLLLSIHIFLFLFLSFSGVSAFRFVLYKMAYPHIDSFISAPSTIHDPATLQFLPRQVAPSHSNNPNLAYNTRYTQPQYIPNAHSRSHSNRTHSVHSHTRHHGTATSFDARPMPQALLDDPAFSTDPRSNPQFHSVAPGNVLTRPLKYSADYPPDRLPHQFRPNDDTANHMWQMPPSHGPTAVPYSQSRQYAVHAAPPSHVRIQQIAQPPPRMPAISAQHAAYAAAPPDVSHNYQNAPPMPRPSLHSTAGAAYPGTWNPPTRSVYSDTESSSGSPISIPRSLPSSSVSSSASLLPSPHHSQENTPLTS